MDSSKRKAPETPSSEWKLPEVRDLTPEEEADLDAMNEELGRLFYGEKLPEARERARRFNGGRS